MLYYNGQFVNQLYFGGEEISDLYIAGKNVYAKINETYPGLIRDANHASGYGIFVLLSPSNNITHIEWASSIPSGVTTKPLTYDTYVSQPEYMFKTPLYDYVDFNKLFEYDEDKTYSIGDAILKWGTYDEPRDIYTCIVDISEPEPFNSAHWKSGYYPRVLGIYDSTRTYNFGDIVVYRNTIYTCLEDIDIPEEFNSSKWQSNYLPVITLYDEYTFYRPGDVVWSSSQRMWRTCIKDNVNVPLTDTDYWSFQYMPNLKGDYNPDLFYTCGDVVWYAGEPRTCVSLEPIKGKAPPSSSSYTYNEYWTTGSYSYIRNGYLLKMIQPYSGATAWPGSSKSGICLYPFDLYKESRSPVHMWIEGTTIKLYSKNHRPKANGQFAIYSNSKIGPDLGTDRILSVLGDFDLSNTFSLYKCFYRCGHICGDNLAFVGMWDVRHVVFFDYCFAECNNGWLLNLHWLGSWNTKSARSMSYMFYNCSLLEDIDDIIDWNVCKVENMSNMFRGCSALVINKNLQWNLANVKDMSNMFKGCTSLTTLSFMSSWRFPKLTDVSNMFDGCSSLTEISGLHWDCSSITNFNHIFARCSNVKVIRELYWTNLKTVPTMFWYCTSLVKADFSRFSAQPGTVFSVGSTLFRGCSNLEKCDLGDLFVSSAYSITYGLGPFSDCTKLSVLIIRNTDYVFSRASWGGNSDGIGNLVRNNGKLYVPQNLLSAYQSSSQYSGITIVPIEGSPYEEPGSL